MAVLTGDDHRKGSTLGYPFGVMGVVSRHRELTCFVVRGVLWWVDAFVSVLVVYKAESPRSPRADDADGDLGSSFILIAPCNALGEE